MGHGPLLGRRAFSFWDIGAPGTWKGASTVTTRPAESGKILRRLVR